MTTQNPQPAGAPQDDSRQTSSGCYESPAPMAAGAAQEQTAQPPSNEEPRAATEPERAEGAGGVTDQIKAFVAARNAALMSLDEQTIRAFFRKWNGRDLPTNEFTFWGSVHKAITGATDLPIELRRKSKAWLDSNGLRSFDDGDLEEAEA